MYITYWNPPKTRQISFEEILAGVTDISNLSRGGDNTSTMTICRDSLTPRLEQVTNIENMINQLAAFNQKYAELESSNLPSHYYHFEIPKKTGGWRPIDAPDKELSDALSELQRLLKS